MLTVMPAHDIRDLQQLQITLHCRKFKFLGANRAHGTECYLCAVLGSYHGAAGVPRPAPAAPHAVLPQLGFSLLGLLGGAVGLRGKLVAIPEKEGGTDNRDTVKVRATQSQRHTRRMDGAAQLLTSW